MARASLCEFRDDDNKWLMMQWQAPSAIDKEEAQRVFGVRLAPPDYGNDINRGAHSPAEDAEGQPQGPGGKPDRAASGDAKTKLPHGQHLTFDVSHDGEWHGVPLSLDTDKTVVALRLDPCSAPGEVTIADLQLRDAEGQALAACPGGR